MKKRLKGLAIIITLVLSVALITGCEIKAGSSGSSSSAKKAYGLGDTFEFDDLEITLGKDISYTKVDNQFSEQNGKDVIKLPITVKNLKDDTHSLNMFYYKCYGAQGVELDNVSSYFDEDSVDFAGKLKTGASYTKYMYILYDGDGDYSIEFNNYSSKIIVDFSIKK